MPTVELRQFRRFIYISDIFQNVTFISLLPQTFVETEIALIGPLTSSCCCEIMTR